MSLIWSYLGQDVRKCSSVSTSFPVQWGHSRASFGSQVCLCLPVSMLRWCLTESVHAQDFSQFRVTHCTQVSCQFIFSI